MLIHSLQVLLLNHLFIFISSVKIHVCNYTYSPLLDSHPLARAAHSAIAGTCLNCVTALSRPSPNLQRPPFHHLQRALSLNLQQTVSRIFFSVLENPQTKGLVQIARNSLRWGYLTAATTAALLLELQKLGVYYIHHSKLSMFNGLHRASIFGTNQIAAYLIEVEGCCRGQEASNVG